MSKGKCYLCGKIIDKRGAIRHLKNCVKKENITKNVDVFHIGLYAGDYWLHIEIPKDYTLRDLDQFIRDIWVECCGHLSEFVINRTEYPSEDYNDPMEEIFEELDNRIYTLGSITDEELKELEDIYSSIKSEKIRGLIGELIKEIKVYKKIIKDKPKPQKLKDTMDVKLEDVLKVGDKFSYVYDFGTPTEINLKVVDERKGWALEYWQETFQ